MSLNDELTLAKSLSATYVSAKIVTGSGIDATGATDSSAAVTTMAANNKWLHFPAGTYLLGSVPLLTGTRITCAPGATIKVKAGGSGFTITGTLGTAITLANTVNRQNYIDAASGTPWSVGQLLYIKGAPTNSTTALPYYATAFTGLTTQLRHVLSVSGSRAYLDGPVYVDQTAPTAQVVTPVTDVLIDGLTATAQDSTANYLVNSAYTDRVRIQNCTLTTVGLSSSVDMELAVDNCVFKLPQYASIFSWHSTRLKFSRNIIQGGNIAYSFLARFVNGIDGEITYNHAARSRFVATAANQNIDGFTWDNEDDAPANIGNLILGNSVNNGGFGTQLGNGRAALHIHYGSFNNVTKNTTTGGDFGIYLSSYGNYNTVEGNSCSKHNGYYGVGIECDLKNTGNRVINNETSGNGFALPLDAGSTIATLDSMTTTEGHGIEFRSTQQANNASNNVSFSNAGAGIAFIGAGGEGIAANNVLRGNAGAGILIDGAGASPNPYMISGNDFAGNGSQVSVIATAYGVTQVNNLPVAPAPGGSTKTASYTLTTNDRYIEANGASLTMTLPDPATVTAWGPLFSIKNANATACTVVSAGTSKTLDGAASQSLAQWAKATYVSDGTQWLTV